MLALANLSTYSENVPDRKMDPTSVREIGKRHPRGGCTNRGGQYCVCRSGISISYLGNAWNGCVCSVPVIMSLILCSSHIRGGCIDIEFSFCEMHDSKNLKQHEEQQRLTLCQVSNDRIKTPRQLSERVFLRRIYFLNSKGFTYIGLVFCTDEFIEHF
jgi:hypothetical protein